MDSYYSVAADHYDICKPQRKESSAFLRLENFLSEIQKGGVLDARRVDDAKSGREYVIDLEGRANEVRSILARPDTNIIFIVGLSGIGKTTLAQQVFHDISENFSATCFVSLDIIDVESKSNYREQVLGKIHDALDLNRGSHHTRSSLLSYLKGRRVLMVLDNVEVEDQLQALRTETWLEGSVSKLIITTANAPLGSPANTFQVSYLSSAESRQLFTHYAFKDGKEPQDLTHLVSRVIDDCENFPLALKVLGGYISKEDALDKQLWLDLLKTLQRAQEVDASNDYRLWAKLRLLIKKSSWILPPFSMGFLLDFLECIWNGCRESPHLALLNLQRRFLVNVIGGKVWMHSFLRNMGKSIACPRNSNVDKWKRIPGSSSAKELIANHQGMVDTLALKIEIRENEILTLKNTTFLNYVHLEYLILDGVRTSAGAVELPRSLVYLRWKDGLFTSCPEDFNRLENSVALELIVCKFMTFLLRGVVNARKLVWLELEGCVSLTGLPPGLSRYLQHLSLRRVSLKNLPSDLGKFKGLRHLQANETKLTRIPGGLSRLVMLSSLDLSGTRVTTLPEAIGGLKGLRKLNLSETMVTSLPDTIGRLQNLESLYLAWSKLRSLPESIAGLKSLEKLGLHGTYVKSLPKSLGELVKLQVLIVRNTPLETLPHSVCELRDLRRLDLCCTQIGRLPDAIGELVGLESFQATYPKLRIGSMPIGMLMGLRGLFCNSCYSEVFVSPVQD